MVQCWTVEQHVALDRLAGLLPVKDLATALGRFGEPHTVRSVVQQAATARVSLRRRRRRHEWSDDEDAVIRAKAGRLSAREIAAEIGQLPGCRRSRTAVKKRASVLGIPLRRTDRSLGLSAVRHLFGVRRATVLGWVEDGCLRVDRHGGGRRGVCWRFRAEDVEGFIAAYPWLYDWRAMWPSGPWRELGRVASLRSPWLTTEQAASALGFRTTWVKDLARRGQLAGAVKVRGGWRIPQSALATAEGGH